MGLRDGRGPLVEIMKETPTALSRAPCRDETPNIPGFLSPRLPSSQLLTVRSAMLSEFFCARRPLLRVFATAGVVLLAAHSVYAATLSRRLVDWQGRFYDRVGSAAALLTPTETTYTALFRPAYAAFDRNASATTGTNLTEMRRVAIAEASSDVMALLVEFALLVLPMALVHPVNRLLRRRYTFEWRMVLMRAYCERWAAMHHLCVEGISQRIQEDTQRFARGLETCVSEIVDAVLTLAVFSPVLVEIGTEVRPPAEGPAAWFGLHYLGDAWLLVGATVLATEGLVVSYAVARRLVALEVNNQVVEAELRKRLVVVEVSGVVHAEIVPPSGADMEDMSPCEWMGSIAPSSSDLETVTSCEAAQSAAACAANGGVECACAETPPPSVPPRDADESATAATVLPPTPMYFAEIFASLRTNYLTLFAHFLAFDTWISAFDQAMAIVPYVILAPLLFREKDPISLGTLVRATSVFGRVFSSLSVPAYNWANVNDFRSVVRRLWVLERSMGMRSVHSPRAPTSPYPPPSLSANGTRVQPPRVRRVRRSKALPPEWCSSMGPLTETERGEL